MQFCFNWLVDVEIILDEMGFGRDGGAWEVRGVEFGMREDLSGVRRG